MGKSWWQWFLPIGFPDPEQALDYDASILVEGYMDLENEHPLKIGYPGKDG